MTPEQDLDQTAEAKDMQSLGEAWRVQLDLAERTDKDWIARGEKVVKIYRDERPAHDGDSKFNILWSNVQTLFPAMYARTPRVEVVRRNKDAEPVARTAAIVLERCLQYELDQYPDFDEAMRLCVTDRLLPGRGTAWVRFEDQVVAKADESPDSGEDALTDDDEDVLTQERATVDYVYWEDFRHSPARVWAEVTWVAKRVYLSLDEVKDRFGDEFKDVPLNHIPVGLDQERDGNELRKAKIWEIWDKQTRRVIWIAEGYGKALDVQDDPLGLDGFFPCPKPLFATQTTDSLVPIPDYVMYQDQADELTLITTRISGLVGALRMVGAYDASEPALANILTSPDNRLVPVSNWSAFSEKGGLDGGISWMPIQEVATALQYLYAAREQVKQAIYEVTGLADIMRGSTKASETYGAQRLKSQYGSLRMAPRQREVAIFASEIMRIKAQIMMDLYEPQTLVDMSGIEGTPDAEGISQAIALMKTEPLRSYRIEVAADSLIEVDQEQERGQRVEFLQAAGGFLQQAMGVVQASPQMLPLISEMLLFGVRGFKSGRDIEAAFEQAMQGLQEQSQQPQEDPAAQAEQQRMQMEQQQAQAKLQADMQVQQVRLQADMRAEQIKAESSMQIERERIQMQAQLEQQRAQMQAEVDQSRAQADAQARVQAEMSKIEFERWKAELDAATKIQIAQIQSAAKGVLQINEATQAATDEIAREVRP